ERVPKGSIAEPQPDDGGLAGADVELILRCGLGSNLVRVDRILPAGRDKVVDSVFDVGRSVGGAENPLVVGVVFGERQAWSSMAMQKEAGEFGRRSFNRDSVSPRHLSQGGFRLLWPPGPGVPEPECRQHVQHRR